MSGEISLKEAVSYVHFHYKECVKCQENFWILKQKYRFFHISCPDLYKIIQAKYNNSNLLNLVEKLKNFQAGYLPICSLLENNSQIWSWIKIRPAVGRGFSCAPALLGSMTQSSLEAKLKAKFDLPFQRYIVCVLWWTIFIKLHNCRTGCVFSNKSNESEAVLMGRKPFYISYN